MSASSDESLSRDIVDQITTNSEKSEPMYEMITKILAEYANAKLEPFKGHPMGRFFRSKIPNMVYQTNIVNAEAYLVAGSIGQGVWATIPWICIYDRSVTISAERGVYIVYLLSQDGNSLYLTFNQGCTDIENKVKEENIKKDISTKKEVTAILQKTVNEIRENVNSRGFRSDNEISLGNNLPKLGYYYEKGTVFYKEYKKGFVPDEIELQADLANMMQIYADYVEYISSEKVTAKEEDMLPDSGIDTEMTVKDAISRIKDYISAKGFTYENGLIENYYLSLKSKPFVILAGISGTGKTRLVKLFAEAVGANTTNGRYKMISVRPDWSDSTDLFGHVDLNSRFLPGEIINFLKKAEKNTAYPYFLCLDEMNLARVEYYLSDILSVMETREFIDEHIRTDPLVQKRYYGTDTDAIARYGTVYLPENLYIIGTVNMDETTFPFSRKVLDRANTIEFSYVDLVPKIDESQDPIPALNLTNSFLKTEFLLLKQCIDDAESVDEYCSELDSINNILKEANAHIGFRVRDEIVFYLVNNKRTELLSSNEVMDNEILQKILPRIQGGNTSVKKMLCGLFKHCAGDFEGYQTEATDISDKMIGIVKSHECKYEKSATKIAFMMRRYEEDGFTSYWL